jgi:hypothetical protein
VVDRRKEVRDELGVGTHERRVVIGLRIVCAKDEPLEVVHVRVEAMPARPFEDRACRFGRQRRMEEEFPEPAGVGERHRPDQPAW